MESSERSVKVVRALWDAFGSGGVERVIELSDPDTEWTPHSGGGQTLRGHAEMRRFFTELEERGAVLVAQADSFEAVEDCVMVHGRLRVEDFRSVSDVDLWWLFEVVDGRVRTARSYTNRDEAMAAAAGS